MALADLPLRAFLPQPTVPYEACTVTRLTIDSHDVLRHLHTALAGALHLLTVFLATQAPVAWPM